MKEKDLKKLKRSELIEIILMLKENEKVLMEQNRQLSERIVARNLTLSTDKDLGMAAIELECAFTEMKMAARKYKALLEEIGMDAIEKRNKDKQ